MRDRLLKNGNYTRVQIIEIYKEARIQNESSLIH